MGKTNDIQTVVARSSLGRAKNYASLNEAVHDTEVGYRTSYNQTGNINIRDDGNVFYRWAGSYEFRDELGLLIAPDRIEAIIHGLGPPTLRITRYERERLRRHPYRGFKVSFRQHGIAPIGGRAKEWRPRQGDGFRRYRGLKRAYEADLRSEDLAEAGCYVKLRKRACWDAWDEEWHGLWKKRCWKRHRAHQWRI